MKEKKYRSLILLLLVFLVGCGNGLEDWQEEYIDQMESVWAESEGDGEDVCFVPWNAYWLYDMDKDGIVELFVENGLCEAGSYSTVYQYKDGKFSKYFEYYTADTAFYTWPDENGVLIIGGITDTKTVKRIYVEDGQIMEEILSDNEAFEGERNDPKTYHVDSEIIEVYTSKTIDPIVAY